MEMPRSYSDAVNQGDAGLVGADIFPEVEAWEITDGAEPEAIIEQAEIQGESDDNSN